MANVPERRVVAAHPRGGETAVGGAAATRTGVGDGAKTAGETPEVQKPWPVEFGWDFPFDSPKPTR